MISEANFHPSTEMLEKFTAGSLLSGLNVAISAHIELCETCRHKTSEIEAKAAIDWLQTNDDQKQNDFSDLALNIVNQPQIEKLREKEAILDQIHMLDHSVRLPKVLAKATSQGLVWKQLGGGINQALMHLDDETQCEFIYMKPGSQTPMHKHQGSETTLVLDGSFNDELGHYQRADFIYRTEKDMHQPRSEEGCLCFSVLDSPLTFTKGLARLLNPFFKYQFRRSAVGRGI